VVIALATVLLLARPAHQWLLWLFGEAERLIQGRDAWGMTRWTAIRFRASEAIQPHR
jgi:hypothetical protein